MRILITGATGFIGFHLAQRLAAAGHEIVAAARQADTWRTRLPAWEWRPCDFMRDTNEEDWTARVADVDLVIMDCLGYSLAMKEHVKKLVSKPVLLPRSMLAAVARELL